MRLIPLLPVLLLILAPSAAAPQDAVDPTIEKAVQKGADYLKSTNKATHPDLVLWALLNAGVKEEDRAFKDRLAIVEKQAVYGTYQAALRALVLAKLDPVRFGPQLRAIGQFLVDSMSQNGQWSYGRNVAVEVDLRKKDPVRFERTLPRRKCRREPEELKPVLDGEIAPSVRAGMGGGDNSNTQFAALGLFACSQSGLRFPKELIQRARKWWEICQCPDGGWGYQGRSGSYGSMTTAGIAALCIYSGILKQDIKGDANIEKGLKWLGDNFSVTQNGSYGDVWKYYYLYGIERVGILTGSPTIGKHRWYDEGARHLLSQQRADGSWQGRHEDGVVATSFAILFLKRATIENRVPVSEQVEIKKDPTPTRNELVLAQIALKADSDPVLPNYGRLVEELRQRVAAGIRAERVPVSLLDDPMKNYPFLYLTGHEETGLSERECDALGKHLKRGGYLYIQNCCRSPEFESSIRKLVKRVAGADLSPVGPDHKVHKARFETGAVVKLEGVEMGGRLAVVYCAEDVCCRWGFEECDDLCSKVTAEESFRVVSNIVAYAFSE